MSIYNSPMTTSSNLKGFTVLITGAAGRIGSSVARKTFMSGASVILADIAKKPLTELKEDLLSLDETRVHAFTNDITTAQGIDSLVSKAIDAAGSINAAVHSAYPRSVGWGTSFENINADNLNLDLSMQLGGAILFSKRILSYFQEQGGGSLIHLSSIQGVQAPKFDHYEGTNMTSPIEYAAIKSGIIAITRWLAKYYANQHIRVNCVSPGGILDSQPQSFLKRYREDCTNIGMLTSDQIASTITYLLSPEAAAINGQNIIIDDGWSL